MTTTRTRPAISPERARSDHDRIEWEVPKADVRPLTDGSWISEGLRIGLGSTQCGKHQMYTPMSWAWYALRPFCPDTGSGGSAGRCPDAP